VHEIAAEPIGSAQLPPGVVEQGQRTRRIFEWLKPDLAAREKRLESGDAIDVDLLVEFLVSRRHEPSPPVRFYQKPRIRKRDLATLVLMDCSGSTGEEREAERIIEVERESALILGQGLAGLGDAFAICGFSGQGRENCEYYVYKGFADAWGPETIRRLMGAAPRSSTRIGAALRHSGTLLASRPSRQKLVLLVTDGRPMDAGYDPETRYAQFDVRMACEENRRKGIHTFAISTEKASRADMEIMFPGRRFAILPSIDALPAVLPRLYMRLTY
jgi:nitric oxide reductase activation protein